MPVVRKIRKIGDSLVVTIPSELARFYELKANDLLEFSHDHGKIFFQKS